MEELIEVDIHKILIKDNYDKRTLYGSLCVPSLTQSYSLCIEYAKNWFLSRFRPDTFKTVYVDGKNIYDDFRSTPKKELLKRSRPALMMAPNIDWGFNNESVDIYPYGIGIYAQTGAFKKSFFRDVERDVFLGIDMRTILMQFNLRMKFDTRPQQLDAYEYIRAAHRVGSTFGEYVDLDFHIPYQLIIQIAKDTGFKVIEEEGKKPIVDNIVKFLQYLNSYSEIPFVYKRRNVTGNHEFFLRMSDLYIHVRPGDISADDGDREGHLHTSFSIDFSFEIRFPCPKMYAYYSNGEHTLQEIYTTWNQPNEQLLNFYTFNVIPIQKQNKFGWPLLLESSYEESNTDEANNPHILEIDFSDLFVDKNIANTIKACLDTAISPSIFLDLIMVNGGNLVNGTMNWSTMKYTSKDPVRAPLTYIGIYCDMNYLNTTFLSSTNGNKNRIDLECNGKSN